MQLFKHLKNHRVLGLIIFAETLIILGLLIHISTLSTTATQAENGNGNSELISQEVRLCNKLPPLERPVCIRIVGMKIATLFSTTEEQIRECMKTRPLWVRYCQEGLNL